MADLCDPLQFCVALFCGLKRVRFLRAFFLIRFHPLQRFCGNFLLFNKNHFSRLTHLTPMPCFHTQQCLCVCLFLGPAQYWLTVRLTEWLWRTARLRWAFVRIGHCGSFVYPCNVQRLSIAKSIKCNRSPNRLARQPSSIHAHYFYMIFVVLEVLMPGCHNFLLIFYAAFLLHCTQQPFSIFPCFFFADLPLLSNFLFFRLCFSRILCHFVCNKDYIYFVAGNSAKGYTREVMLHIIFLCVETPLRLKVESSRS